MLKVLLMCTEDVASVNIRDRLLEVGNFEPVGKLDDRPIHLGHDLLLVEIEGLHLYLDGVDQRIRDTLDEGILPTIHMGPVTEAPLDLLVFLSKHSSEKNIESLTVHPPGNYLSADHGGKPGLLPPSAPHLMTSALRSLYKEKRKLGISDQTTFEVTHHGPAIDSPSFFIEIGSGPERWGTPELGESIARSLLSDEFLSPMCDIPVAIGVGGGHYAPRFTDRAMRKKFSFGHMIPDYILSTGNDLCHLVKMAKGSTPDAEVIFPHRSERNSKLLDGLEEIALQNDLKLIQV